MALAPPPGKVSARLRAFPLTSSRAVAVVAVAAFCWAGWTQLTPRRKPLPTPAAERAAAATAFGTIMGTAHSQNAGLAASINSFGDELAMQLQPKIGAEPAGVFLSPYGIAQALAMLLNGVEQGAESYRQLQSAVYGGGSQEGDGGLSLEALNTQLREMSAALVKPPSNDLTVSEGNSAWLAKKYQLQPAFADTLRAVFGTAAQPITTAAAINDWVSQATQGKIKTIVDEGAVAQAILVLVNAIYFKGLWQHQFDKSSSHAMDFFQLQHSSPPMRAAAMFQTYKGKTAVQVATLTAQAGSASVECAAVQLPYRGDEFYAVAAMPRGELSGDAAEGGQRGLVTPAGTVPYSDALRACRRTVLANLPAAGSDGGNATAASSSSWEVPRSADVKVFLPRFEIEFSASLVEPLRALGIRKPFDGGDITKIAADAQGGPIGDLAVSDVLHKVYVKVDEEGTEAAAVTAVIMVRSMMPRPREEIELRFDRPFVFAVVHKASGLALFSGEVYRPEEWSEPQ